MQSVTDGLRSWHVTREHHFVTGQDHGGTHLSREPVDADHLEVVVEHCSSLVMLEYVDVLRTHTDVGNQSVFARPLATSPDGSEELAGRIEHREFGLSRSRNEEAASAVNRDARHSRDNV